MASYTRPYQRKLRKRSRTLPIPGKGENEGRYYHCWNCGFVCDSQRDSLGDSESSAGNEHTDFNNLANSDPYTNNAGRHLSLRTCLDHQYVAMRIGADGEPKTIVHIYTSDVTSGCPFCGCTNWRGDY